ncbi:MAG: twin-arginine translocation signal domain-containing protein [SAR202 cluster bacterium]|nr:twin-arginine translocation signal domain-containing protein [SAR202 cluster bacterium]
MASDRHVDVTYAGTCMGLRTSTERSIRRSQLAEPVRTETEGVSRRRFLKFTGLGLAAGFAALLVGNRAKGPQPVRKFDVAEDSMFRPRGDVQNRS